jgi:hypothetical protein
METRYGCTVAIFGAKYLSMFKFWFEVDVKISFVSLYTIKKNTEALVVACKEIVLVVNADKTKYMIMSRDQNAGRSHCTKVDNSFEMLQDFRYLGTTLTYQNSIQ